MNFYILHLSLLNVMATPASPCQHCCGCWWCLLIWRWLLGKNQTTPCQFAFSHQETYTLCNSAALTALAEGFRLLLMPCQIRLQREDISRVENTKMLLLTISGRQEGCKRGKTIPSLQYWNLKKLLENWQDTVEFDYGTPVRMPAFITLISNFMLSFYSQVQSHIKQERRQLVSQLTWVYRIQRMRP